MSVRRIKNHGTWVWQARVAYKGLRRAAFRPTKDEARTAEAELLRALKAEHGQADQAAAAPATLKQLFEFYVADLEARGKTPDSVVRAAQTADVIERLMPELLARPVSRIGDAELYAFLNARLREGKLVRERSGEEIRERREPAKPSTINRDLRTLRAMLKRARPEYRFPAGAFLPEDETRVRWLRPEEELLVLDTMRSPFREIAKLAALTLMRLSEIRLLRREYVHLEQGVILLPRAKAGARPVILSGEAQKILRGQLEGTGGAAGGLRFTAPIVMALGGWKTERMMRRYAAVTDQTLRAAAEAVSGAESALAHR
jgi:integrase